MYVLHTFPVSHTIYPALRVSMADRDLAIGGDRNFASSAGYMHIKSSFLPSARARIYTYNCSGVQRERKRSVLRKIVRSVGEDPGTTACPEPVKTSLLAPPPPPDPLALFHHPPRRSPLRPAIAASGAKIKIGIGATTEGGGRGGKGGNARRSSARR